MQEHAPRLISLQKVWDLAPHNALTDLNRFCESWYCTFREGEQHVEGDNGKIRLLKDWQPVALFEEEGVDLRDPKLSITPDGMLMLLMEGVTEATRQPRVTFSPDGLHWSPLKPILLEGDWLWRVTWHLGKAYGASYVQSDPNDRYKEWDLTLYESDDGIDYRSIVEWEIPGYPNETTLRFRPSGEMVALVRREQKPDRAAWLGKSTPPYRKWEWESLEMAVGGPNFLIIDDTLWDDTLWIGGRLTLTTPYGHFEKTALSASESLVLPSGGDCSYPGMIFHEGHLWMSYYSSHEGKAAIYLAEIALPE